MCGVVGVFHYADPDRTADEALLRRMARILEHRGPDDEQVFVAGPVGLGHRRLAIVDLSESGRQPMSSVSGRSCLSYNGEFYNHASFRRRLEAKGCSFRGSSDTETLLYLLEEYGPGALKDAAGIFGFAWWDAENRRLILGRDSVGVKQLYFHDDGRRVIFASEIKALFADPTVPRRVDPTAVNQYLHFHTPLFDRTFFDGIEQVRPGEYVEFSGRGRARRVYWRPSGFEPRAGSPEDQVRELRELLGSVVREQLMSDVPVGAFFSGGIDSTAVASFAARTGKRIRCYGIHFANQGVVDERPFQEQAARALGLELNLTTVEGRDFPSDLQRLLYFQDQPVIGAALIPMYYVSRLAARDVKVCLGGQAADEVFGGYARYALANPTQVVSSWFRGRRAISDSSGKSSGGRVGGNLLKQAMQAGNARRLLQAGSNALDWRERYFGHFSKVPESAWAEAFAVPSFVSRADAREMFIAGLDESPATEPSDKLLHWESRTYLPGLFQQDDRMSMANSLESRVPIADPRVVDFAFRTPFSLKFRAGASKWVLRQAVSDVIPEVVLNRRKVGFDTPAVRWMRDDHSDFVRDLLLSSRARSRGWIRARGIEDLLSRPEQPMWFDRVWKLACLESWARIFLDGERPAGTGSTTEQHRAA